MIGTLNVRILILSISILSISGNAQIQEPSSSLVRNLSSYKSSFNQQVSDACIDSLGYLRIFGSYDGGYYNGLKFKKHPYEEGNRGFNIQCFKDDFGRVWVVKYSGKLFYLQNDSLFFYHPSDSIKHLINKGRFESIGFDKDSVLHIGTRGKGYYKLHPNGRIEKMIGRESNLKGFMVIQRPGSKLFSFSISHFDDSLKGPYKFHFLNQDLSVRYSAPIAYQWPAYLSSLSTFTDGSYLSTIGNKMLIHFDSLGILNSIEYSSLTTRAFVDSRDEIWLGTDDKGLHRFHDIDDLNKPPEIYFDNEVAYVVSENDRGGLWIKSTYTGLNFMPNASLRVFSNPGLTNKANGVVYSTDKEMYFNAGIAIYKMGRDGLIKKLPRPIILDEKPVNQLMSTLYYDSITSKLWLGGRRHISYFNGVEWHKPKFADEIAKIGTVRYISGSHLPDVTCVAVANFIYWIRNDSIIKKKKIGDTQITKLLFEKEGKIWIAGMAGLLSYENGEVKGYGYISKVLNKRVHNVFNYKSKIWVVLNNSVGYLKDDSLHIIKNIPRGDFFPDSKDGFWNRLPNGHLLHLWMNTNDSIILNFYDLNARMANGEAGQSFAWGDTLFLSTNEGLRYINSSTLDTNLNSPIILVDQISVNSRLRDLKDYFELNYDEDLIQFKYSAIDHHLNEQKVQFRYKLIGLKDEWHTTNETFARFTSLDPGSYTFVLQVKTDNSEVYCKPLELRFMIHPPYWETWWFRAVLLLLAAGLVIGIFKFQLKAQKRKDQMLIDKLLAEQQALRAQLNPHFIFNSLSSIQHLVFSNDRIFATENIAIFAKLMRRVLSLSQKEWVSIKEEIETLELYLQLEALRFEEQFDYSIDIAKNINASGILMPTLILQPIVENSIRHGLLKKEVAGGEILIKAYKEGTELILEVLDNGVGFSNQKFNENKEDNEHTSFGLNSINRRIEILNASFNLGASFSLRESKDSDGHVSGSIAQIRMQIKSNKN